MIDTDKYEGHTPAPWLATHDLVETEAKYSGKFTHVINHDGWRVWVGEKGTDVPHLQNNRFDSGNLDEADARLIADAPLLLAEYKKLRQFARLSNYSFSESLPELMQALVDERAEVKRLRGLLKITAQSYLDDVRSEDMLGEISVKKEYETCKEIGDAIGATINAEYCFIHKEGEEE